MKTITSVRYKYIFVVLVYKNIDVLKDFFVSLHLHDYKVIVVNSYYDDNSLRQCSEVASQYNADFIPIDNKGFGYGNNVGTKYVMDHYEYDYLILSNSDIHVNTIEALEDLSDTCAVVAPHTHLPEGKAQNPNIPWRAECLFWMFKKAYDNDSSFLLLFPHAFTRLSRELYRVYRLFVKRSFYKIYSCHGSFIIFTRKAVERLFPFFNDKMFLYNEELYLAENCRMKNIPIYYCPKIDVLHLEGASSDHNAGFERNKESFAILYNWMKGLS